MTLELFYNSDIFHSIAKDAQESEDNKSYEICDNMFMKTYKV